MSVLHPSPITEIASARQFAGGRETRTFRQWPALSALLASDLCCLCFAAGAAILFWRLADARLTPEMYVSLSPVLLTFLLAYWASGLYPGFGRNPADELRRLSAATSLVYCALAVTVFLMKNGIAFSRAVFLLAWMQSIVAVPIGRAIVRRLCGRRAWWGESVVIVGPRATAEVVARELRNRPERGVKPVLVCEPSRVPRTEKFVRHAILVTGPSIDTVSAYRELSRTFRRVTLVPELNGMSSLWVEARDLGGVIGLEIGQRLLMPGARLAKRSLDLCLVTVTAFVALPFVAVIATAIRLTSPGPVFYRQVRYGRDGCIFVALKFRSMVVNAGEVLDRYLESNPAMRVEWERDHKLKNDPRITWVGRLLRRTSLDELPQIWNVLLGQMSVVGPRPIVADEIARYGDAYDLYMQVTPGITGLWQVSGRNNVSYEDRVQLDTYYIRNWSPWLDLYILARTVAAVLTARGAY